MSGSWEEGVDRKGWRRRCSRMSRACAYDKNGMTGQANEKQTLDSLRSRKSW